MGRPLAISRSAQTCALGAAMAGAVVAGRRAGGHATFADAVKAMTGVQAKVFKPVPPHGAVYDRLYRLYRTLHDAFGVRNHAADLSPVMKELLSIRDEARK
jgi:L-ribulokinase